MYSTMIPAIDVPAAVAASSRTASVFNYHIKEEESDDDDDDDNDHDKNIRKLIAIENLDTTTSQQQQEQSLLPKLIEKSVIVHKDENGFGLRVKGQSPVYVEHVHENGAAWRAGVRQMDRVSKVNGVPVTGADHKDVILMFKSCTRFVSLTLLSCMAPVAAPEWKPLIERSNKSSWQDSNLGSSIALTSALHSDNLIGSVHQKAALGQRLSSVTLSCDRARLLGARTTMDSSAYATSADSMTSEIVRHRTNSSNKLRLGNHHYHHSFSSADNRRLELSKLRLAEQQQQNGPTTTDRKLHDKQQQQQVAITPMANSARRSESVAHRPPSHLHSAQSANTLQSSSQQASQKHHRNSDMRLAVCINCRLLARQSSDLVPIGCVQCQLNSQQACAADTANQRQRAAGGSLRDPRGQHDTLRSQTGSPPARKQALPQFELTQSDSMSSFASANAQKDGGQLRDNGATGATPSTVLNKQQQQQQPAARQLAQGAPATTNKRLEIIRELIDTEKTHTDRLRCLDELFYRPLKEGGHMTAEQLRMVFSCHRTLYKIHRQIYRTLISSNQNLYAEPMIGSALLEIFEGDLKRRLERAACSFCAAQSTNADLLNKLTRRDTKVGEFLAQVTSQQMVGRLGIKDLLASCFQRLTKYPLLLENLRKATPQSLSPAPPAGRRRPRALPRLANSVDDEVEVNNRSADLDDDADEDDDDDEAPDEEEAETDDEENEAIRNSRRMLAISLAEEREFIERALNQSRQILVRVNDSVKVAMSHNKLKEIWKRTDKHPGVPLIDISKQQVIHEGLLTLRLSKRSFDVYVLLLNDYLIILTREGQDKYRLKFFTPEGGRLSVTSSPNVYSPVFVIDEHLTTRDAATDENGFYLLCKRKDDSRIYEFASRSPAERLKWRDRIQWTIERQMSKADRRGSCESTITKSSSELSTKQDLDTTPTPKAVVGAESMPRPPPNGSSEAAATKEDNKSMNSPERAKKEPTKIEGTISYVEDDGIVMPSKIGSSKVLVDQAIQVTILDTSKNSVPPPD